MKLTEEVLRDLLINLPHYQRLSVPARRSLIALDGRNTLLRPAQFQGTLDELLESGFLLSIDGIRFEMDPVRQELVRTLRFLRPYRIMEDPSVLTFSNYMVNHLSPEERLALLDEVRFRDRTMMLFRKVASPDWIQEFLESPDGREWEEPSRVPDRAPMLASPKVFQEAQNLVRLALETGGPIPMDRLGERAERDLLIPALRACLRYGLVFAALDPQTAAPVVTLWPELKVDLKPRSTSAPVAVKPGETFESAFLAEDITAVLIAAATAPIRLTADGRLFAKTVREIAARLRPFPKWVDDSLDFDVELRVQVGAAYAETFELLKRDPPGRLQISARGRKWLALGSRQRLRVLIDGVWNRSQSVPGFEDYEGAQIGPFGPRVHVNTRVKTPPKIDMALMKAYASLAGEEFFPLDQILSYSQANNPLMEIFRRDKLAYFSIDSQYLDRPNRQALDYAWPRVVLGFLRTRLFPLGCVRVANAAADVSIAITAAGRYYLGQTDEWHSGGAIAAQVVVQPNFEVTFLGEAPEAEAEIARFSERRGQHFQITKKSIFEAAEIGMNAAETLAILERICTRDVPANVRREIAGWFAQCRKVSFESAMLIRCPDPETAVRVIGLAKGSATPLTETILEYRDPGKQRAALVKKLKGMGVLVSIQEPSVVVSRPAVRRRRSRW